MKRVKKPVFFVVALLILALVVTSLFGVYGQHGDFKVTYIKGAGDIRWGIDIRGGVEATFSPADGVEATTEQLEACLLYTSSCRSAGQGFLLLSAVSQSHYIL